jgi:hypothetical protein
MNKNIFRFSISIFAKNYFLFLQSFVLLCVLGIMSLAMDATTWLKFKAKNPNQYGLAIWKSPHISMKDRFEALSGMPIPEMKDVKQELVSRFNNRTNSNFTKPEDIPSDSIIYEDLSHMDDAFLKVEHAVKAQEILQEILQTVLGSLHILSRSDILRTLANVCICFHKYEKKKKSIQNLTLEELNKIIEYEATLEEIEALHLDTETHSQICDAYFGSK